METVELKTYAVEVKQIILPLEYNKKLVSFICSIFNVSVEESLYFVHIAQLIPLRLKTKKIFDLVHLNGLYEFISIRPCDNTETYRLTLKENNETKLQLVKDFKEYFNFDLKEAKEIIDELYRDSKKAEVFLNLPTLPVNSLNGCTFTKSIRNAIQFTKITNNWVDKLEIPHSNALIKVEKPMPQHSLIYNAITEYNDVYADYIGAIETYEKLKKDFEICERKLKEAQEKYENLELVAWYKFFKP